MKKQKTNGREKKETMLTTLNYSSSRAFPGFLLFVPHPPLSHFISEIIVFVEREKEKCIENVRLSNEEKEGRWINLNCC